MLNLCRRFKEDKGEIAALRTKEQGDWKKLTVEEKKVGYRKFYWDLNLLKNTVNYTHSTFDTPQHPPGPLPRLLLSNSGRGGGSHWRGQVHPWLRARRRLHRHLGILLDEVRRLWSPARHHHQRREAEGPDRPYDRHQGQPCRGNFFELRL